MKDVVVKVDHTYSHLTYRKSSRLACQQKVEPVAPGFVQMDATMLSPVPQGLSADHLLQSLLTGLGEQSVGD